MIFLELDEYCLSEKGCEDARTRRSEALLLRRADDKGIHQGLGAYSFYYSGYMRILLLFFPSARGRGGIVRVS